MSPASSTATPRRPLGLAADGEADFHTIPAEPRAGAGTGSVRGAVCTRAGRPTHFGDIARNFRLPAEPSPTVSAMPRKKAFGAHAQSAHIALSALTRSF